MLMTFLFVYFCSIPLTFWLLMRKVRQSQDIKGEDIMYGALISIVPLMNLVAVWFMYELNTRTFFKRRK